MVCLSKLSGLPLREATRKLRITSETFVIVIRKESLFGDRKNLAMIKNPTSGKGEGALCFLKFLFKVLGGDFLRFSHVEYEVDEDFKGRRAKDQSKFDAIYKAVEDFNRQVTKRVVSDMYVETLLDANGAEVGIRLFFTFNFPSENSMEKLCMNGMKFLEKRRYIRKSKERTTQKKEYVVANVPDWEKFNWNMFLVDYCNYPPNKETINDLMEDEYSPVNLFRLNFETGDNVCVKNKVINEEFASHVCEYQRDLTNYLVTDENDGKQYLDFFNVRGCVSVVPANIKGTSFKNMACQIRFPDPKTDRVYMDDDEQNIRTEEYNQMRKELNHMYRILNWEDHRNTTLKYERSGFPRNCIVDVAKESLPEIRAQEQVCKAIWDKIDNDESDEDMSEGEDEDPRERYKVECQKLEDIQRMYFSTLQSVLVNSDSKYLQKNYKRADIFWQHFCNDIRIKHEQQATPSRGYDYNTLEADYEYLQPADAKHLSPAGNYFIYFRSALEHVDAFMLHKPLTLEWLAMKDRWIVFHKETEQFPPNHFKGLRTNIIKFGPQSAGKSHCDKLSAKLSIPGTIEFVSQKSAKADMCGGDERISEVWDEVPKTWLKDSQGQTETGSGQGKSVLSEGVASTKRAQIDANTNEVIQNSSIRYKELQVIANTNEGRHKLDPSYLSRFLCLTMPEQRRNQMNTTHCLTLTSDELERVKNFKAKFELECQVDDYLIQLVMLCQYCGILPYVNLDIPKRLYRWIFAQKMSDEGFCESEGLPRNLIRNLNGCTTLTILVALSNTIHNPHHDIYGKPLAFESMMALKPHLICTEEIAGFVFSLQMSQMEDETTPKVLRSMLYNVANYPRSEAEWKKYDDSVGSSQETTERTEPHGITYHRKYLHGQPLDNSFDYNYIDLNNCNRKEIMTLISDGCKEEMGKLNDVRIRGVLHSLSAQIKRTRHYTGPKSDDWEPLKVPKFESVKTYVSRKHGAPSGYKILREYVDTKMGRFTEEFEKTFKKYCASIFDEDRKIVLCDDYARHFHRGHIYDMPQILKVMEVAKPDCICRVMRPGDVDPIVIETPAMYEYFVDHTKEEDLIKCTFDKDTRKFHTDADGEAYLLDCSLREFFMESHARNSCLPFDFQHIECFDKEWSNQWIAHGIPENLSYPEYKLKREIGKIDRGRFGNTRPKNARVLKRKRRTLFNTIDPSFKRRFRNVGSSSSSSSGIANEMQELGL